MRTNIKTTHAGAAKDRPRVLWALFIALAVAMLAGCAGSPLDRDARTKIASVTPVSVTGSVTPLQGRVDFFRIDFRQPQTAPAGGLAK